MYIIRDMRENDRTQVYEMMRVFYGSDAVSTDGSPEIFRNDIDNCLSDSPYLHGFVFDNGGELLGYAMVAKSFSTEFGKQCLWIEDLYIKPNARNKGLGSEFLRYIDAAYPEAVIRLEAEPENQNALFVYKKQGFGELPYIELIKRR